MTCHACGVVLDSLNPKVDTPVLFGFRDGIGSVWLEWFCDRLCIPALWRAESHGLVQ